MKKYKVYYTGSKNGSIMVDANSNTEAEDMVWDWLQDSEISEDYPIALDYEIHCKELIQ